MREMYHRRTSSSANAVYSFIDKKLPASHSFAAAAAAIFITVLLFAFVCLAAATYISASSELTSEKNIAEQCSTYYAAETAAADILLSLASDDGISLTDAAGELVYMYDDSRITISRNSGNFYFDVPAGQKKSLHVTARITGGDIDIIRWYIKD